MIKVNNGEIMIKGEDTEVLAEYATLTVKLAQKVGKEKVENLVDFALHRAVEGYKKFLKKLGFDEDEIAEQLEKDGLVDDEDDEDEDEDEDDEEEE